VSASAEAQRYALVWTATFARTARKFLRRHPELAGIFRDAIEQLETDPDAPRLRRHPLQGRHAGKFSARLTYEHRIVFLLRVREREVVLLDIGSHDEVYRG